jgi:hypothetical protein
MSDEEEDSTVKEMMRQAVISKANGHHSNGHNESASSDLVIHEGFAVS